MVCEFRRKNVLSKFKGREGHPVFDKRWQSLPITLSLQLYLCINLFGQFYPQDYCNTINDLSRHNLSLKCLSTCWALVLAHSCLDVAFRSL